MFKLKNKSAIKKRIKLSASGLVRFGRSGKQHGMMKANRRRLHLKKRMGVAKKSDHQWGIIVKSMV